MKEPHFHRLLHLNPHPGSPPDLLNQAEKEIQMIQINKSFYSYIGQD